MLVALVLLTACLNVAGLMLARSADRRREMAIRSSIGAGTSRIVRQILTESLLISIAGGLIGVGLAVVICRLLSQWHAPLDTPVQFELSPDWRVFFFAAAVSMVTGILFGLGPALQLSKTDVNGVLKGDTGISVPKFRRRIGFRDLLVAAEIALCFVLVFASLLSIRGLQNALNMPLGFNPRGVTTAAFDLGLAGYSESQGRGFQVRVTDAVRELPGIVSVAYANSLPLSADQSTTAVQGEDQPIEKGRKARSAIFYQISPGYFATLGIPLLRGCDFDPHDNNHAPLVAIVNRTFANSILHTLNPVGKAFRWGFADKRVQVIGLVEDGKYGSLTESPRPALFRPISQQYNSTTTLVIKSRRPSYEIIKEIQRLIAAIDSRLPIYGAGSLWSMLGFALFPMHAAAVSLTAFGLLALVLAVTGIHGLISYAVSRSTREIGIRVAIGARSSQILRLVFARLIPLVLFGLAAGVVLAVAAGQALSSVVYGISPREPHLILFVLASLFIAAGLSCWKPALRALRNRSHGCASI